MLVAHLVRYTTSDSSSLPLLRLPLRLRQLGMRVSPCVRPLPPAAARRSRMSSPAQQPRPAPCAAAAEPSDAAAASDVAQPPPQGAILGLPAPRPVKEGDAPVRSIDLSSGASVALDALGPVVVNEDGTLSRIGNWAQMTPLEQATTQRRISARNNERLAALRAKQAIASPALD